jgi:Tol biopolymer transport system component
MKVSSFLFLFFLHTIGLAQDNPTGIFSAQTDVGHPKKRGSVQYDAGSQTYTLKGAGYNIWFNRDEFQYAYKKLKGDFILTANFEFVGQGSNHHRKIGWMVRAAADAEAIHMSAVSHGDGLTVLQWRPLRGAYMRDPEDQLFFSKRSFQVIQLERSGNRFIMRVAHPGEPLQIVGIKEMPEMPDSALAGLFICSHDTDVVEEARVWNVRIDKPVAEDYNAYRQGFINSRLEVMDVVDGRRKVIHESTGRFEAPNYMPGGKKLLFNADGSMYTIPVEGGATEKFAVGDLDRLNNDHGISFDGKLLAVSHHRTGLAGGGSTVYVMPLTGGTPKLLTPKTPSYWHSWAPNSKEVIYVAQRDSGVFNLYKMNVNGGAEIPLTTNTTGHVDGPEYAPDGKYIYYNANVTGTMQIWRMKPDGSGKEQITFDEYHNWFPHISPDGKWMVMISFPPGIDPADHPFYKRVLLRLMPLTTVGAPRVIAYLYGGQGTINVPSWSPDGKYIAFVSNY